MNREDCYLLEEKLLFDILQELKTLNAKLSPEIKKVKTENKAVPSSVPCKYCGGTHENTGQMLACARKKKKEGMK